MNSMASRQMKLLSLQAKSKIGGGPNTRVQPIVRRVGATYVYTDTVPATGEWWYWLADVDTQGGETIHSPVSVAVGPNAGLSHRVYLPLVV